MYSFEERAGVLPRMFISMIEPVYHVYEAIYMLKQSYVNDCFAFVYLYGTALKHVHCDYVI